MHVKEMVIKMQSYEFLIKIQIHVHMYNSFVICLKRVRFVIYWFVLFCFAYTFNVMNFHFAPFVFIICLNYEINYKQENVFILFNLILWISPLLQFNSSLKN